MSMQTVDSPSGQTNEYTQPGPAGSTPPPDTTMPPSGETKPLIPKGPLIAGIIGVLVLGVLFIVLIVWLVSNPDRAASIEAIRDILIIALALESCLFGIVLMLLLVMMVRLVNMLEFEIKPILQKTNETLNMLRGTSMFVSQNVVKPVTKANSYMAGVRRSLRVLFGNPDKNLPK